VDGKAVSAPVGGRIPLPESKDGKAIVIAAKFTALGDVKTKLYVGAGDAYAIQLDGKAIGKGTGFRSINPAPDREEFEVAIPKGDHELTIELQHAGAARWIHARFLDPDRKLRQADGN
ncbi:MAG: hypothetical protein JNK93_16885, partial [Planctomycetia bacterium]|nr:hypothetical protein [Planctomycetia bacterium]